jgi:hypothetical protein
MARTHTPPRRVRRTAPIDAPIRNSVLAALLASEYKRLLSRLEHVTLKRSQVIYRADQRVASVYFPEEAVVPATFTPVLALPPHPCCLRRRATAHPESVQAS